MSPGGKSPRRPPFHFYCEPDELACFGPYAIRRPRPGDFLSPDNKAAHKLRALNDFLPRALRQRTTAPRGEPRDESERNTGPRNFQGGASGGRTRGGLSWSRSMATATRNALAGKVIPAPEERAASTSNASAGRPDRTRPGGPRRVQKGKRKKRGRFQSPCCLEKSLAARPAYWKSRSSAPYRSRCTFERTAVLHTLTISNVAARNDIPLRNP